MMWGITSTSHTSSTGWRRILKAQTQKYNIKTTRKRLGIRCGWVRHVLWMNTISLKSTGKYDQEYWDRLGYENVLEIWQLNRDWNKVFALMHDFITSTYSSQPDYNTTSFEKDISSYSASRRRSSWRHIETLKRRKWIQVDYTQIIWTGHTRHSGCLQER